MNKSFYLPKHNEYIKGPKNFDSVNRYFLIRDADPSNKINKSVICVGYSQGRKKGFSFTILNNVDPNMKQMKSFIVNRCKRGYRLVDSENVTLERKEFFDFASNSRFHTEGNFNSEFKDGEGYSFTPRIMIKK